MRLKTAAIDSEYWSSGRVSFVVQDNAAQSLTQIFHEANPRAFVHRTIPDSCARRVINLHKHACIAYVCRHGAGVSWGMFTVVTDVDPPNWISDAHSIAGVMTQNIMHIAIALEISTLVKLYEKFEKITPLIKSYINKFLTHSLSIIFLF